MLRGKRSHDRAFSLLELVIVVVIIGIIAAIAIPRMSRGSAGAAESALAGNLAVMRNAVDLFAAEHGGAFPTVANFSDQLTTYSNSAGEAQDTKDTTHIYGPYLRKVPPLPTGTYKDQTGVAAPGAVPPVAEVATGGTVGWLYDVNSGQVWANDANNFDK